MKTGLEGKTAIITGAGQGIGLGIAEALADEGALVGLADVKFENAQKQAEILNAKGKKALALQVDVSSSKSMAEAVCG